MPQTAEQNKLTEQAERAEQTELDCAASEALGGKICTAGLAAQSECRCWS